MPIKMLATLFSTALSLVYAGNASAYNWKWYIDAGIINGGDDLADVPVLTCNDYYCDVHIDTIKAGGGADLNIGVEFQDVIDNFGFRVTYGRARDSVSAGGQSVYFSRPHYNLLAHYRIDKHVISAGQAKFFDAKLNFSDVGGGEFEFDKATGTLVEYRYQYTRVIGIGFQHLTVDYKLSSYNQAPIPNGDVVNGDYNGLFFVFVF